MLIWVNKKKAEKNIKNVWKAFSNRTLKPELDAKDSEVFATSMAWIVYTFGILRLKSPDEWDDVKCEYDTEESK